MIYTISEICEKLNLDKNSKLREILCLPQFESKRIGNGRYRFEYNFETPDFIEIEKIYNSKSRPIKIGGCALTVREKEIYLLLVDKGLSFKQISEFLNLSYSTVRKEVDTICKKKRVSGSQRLIQLAVKYWRKKYRDAVLS